MTPHHLIIGNSFSSIEGLTREQMSELRDILSFSEETRRFGRFQTVKRYLISKRGHFPSGLLRQVDDFLANEGILHTIKRTDNRKKPISEPDLYKNFALPFKPYPEQIEAVQAAVKLGRTTLSVPTGVGKSVIICLLVAALGRKALIVVPTLSLKEQLTKTVKELFGPSSQHVTVENIDSPRLKTPGNHDVLVCDEAHHAAAATYQILNRTAWQGIYYRFFFTATPFRSRDNETIVMQALTGDVGYTMTFETAVDKGYICPIEVYYYALPKQKMKGNPSAWQAVYSELIVNNAVRNNLIAYILKNLHESKQSTLCLIKEIAHGAILSEATGAAFAHAQGEDCAELVEWFSDGRLSSLIGTTGIVSEGVDTKAAEWVILGAGGKSKNQLMQSIGRGVRRFKDKKSAKIIMFRDASNKFLLDHFKAQVKAIKEEYGVTPLQLDLPEGIV